MSIDGLIQYGALAVVSLYSTFILVRQFVRGELAERGGSGAAPVALRPRRAEVGAGRRGRVAPAGPRRVSLAG